MRTTNSLCTGTMDTWYQSNQKLVSMLLQVSISMAVAFMCVCHATGVAVEFMSPSSTYFPHRIRPLIQKNKRLPAPPLRKKRYQSGKDASGERNDAKREAQTEVAPVLHREFAHNWQRHLRVEVAQCVFHRRRNQP